MKSHLAYFKGSMIFTVFALIFAGLVGFFEGNYMLQAAFSAMISSGILGLLETSVSLDNAVVNAKYLEQLNDRSRQWFLTWGMVIAVFGMRLLLPILVVSVSAGISPVEATVLALSKPEEYRHHIESAHIEIMGFGAAFLLMVFIEYFFNEEKDTHWIPGLEQAAALVGKIPYITLPLGIAVMGSVAYFAPHDQKKFAIAAVAGLLVFFLTGKLKDFLESKQEESPVAAVAAKNVTGLMMGSLIFLEVLDASFSFDGVIAAFAVTSNFVLIAAGLGIGAMFVRSLTIYLVDQGTMSELIYLEHAAMWSIGWLVVAMSMAAYGIELGDVVVAGVAALIIVIGGSHSYMIRENLPVDQLKD